jgi:hypothetical protein
VNGVIVKLLPPNRYNGGSHLAGEFAFFFFDNSYKVEKIIFLGADGSRLPTHPPEGLI